MRPQNSSNGHDMPMSTPWEGVDFSGLSMVLGIGTGRLIRLLGQKTADLQGNLLVVSSRPQRLRSLAPLRQRGDLTLIRGRPRHIPVLSETIDLLVVNGVLREVPEAKLEAMFEELWRVLIPGGKLRISDIIEPSEAEHAQAWAERNRIVRKLGAAMVRPTALSVSLPRTAMALRAVGFEGLALSILPGYLLTDAWLEETVNAVRTMAARLVDPKVRSEIVRRDVARLIGTYAQGGQRAAERFVMKASKVGDLALHMEAPFSQEDLFRRAD